MTTFKRFLTISSENKMNIKTKQGFLRYFKSVRLAFSFFLSLGKKARRTKVFYAISFVPILMALVIKLLRFFYAHREIQGISIFSNMIMVFYLQFLILILALFFGTSISGLASAVSRTCSRVIPMLIPMNPTSCANRETGHIIMNRIIIIRISSPSVNLMQRRR